MIVRTLLFLVFSFASLNLFALLPPYYQSTGEINTILTDADVIKRIGSGRIVKSIERTETGDYLLTTVDGRTLEIKMMVVPRPAGMVGPVKFKVVPGRMTCNIPVNSALEIPNN